MNKQIQLTSDNRILLRLSDGKEEKEVLFDFNDYYRGYYPECRFTAAAAAGSLFYLAGTEEGKRPYLFASETGNVWTQVNIASRFSWTVPEDYGDILAILCDERDRIPLLFTENGYLVLVPDCPKCVSVRRISDRHIQKTGIFEGNIVITEDTGEERRIRIRSAQKFTCAWSFACPYLKNGGLLLDLRSPQEAAAFPLPGACVVPDGFLEPLLNLLPKNRYLFFVCERGFLSEQAVVSARERGFSCAYTLGSAADVLEQMEEDGSA